MVPIQACDTKGLNAKTSFITKVSSITDDQMLRFHTYCWMHWHSAQMSDKFARNSLLKKVRLSYDLIQDLQTQVQWANGDFGVNSFDSNYTFTFVVRTVPLKIQRLCPTVFVFVLDVSRLRSQRCPKSKQTFSHSNKQKFE